MDPRSMIEVRAAHNGMGRGLFATVDIPMGTYILTESPVILLSRSATPFQDFCDALSSIGTKMTEFEDLYCNVRLLNENLAGNIVTQIRSEDPQTPADVQNEDFRKFLKLYAIYHTNASIITKDNKDAGSAVFLTCSRINHSCVPNSYSIWNDKTDRQTIQTGRDIKAGQQIFVNYLGDRGDFMTHEQRLRQTQTHWGFTCNCRACTKPEIADRVRRDMTSLRRSLDQSHQKWPLVDSETRKAIALKAVQYAEELLRLMEESELGGWKVCQTYQDCARYNMYLGNEAEAVSYARRFLDTQEIFFGEDSIDREWIEAIGLRFT
ncbi:hypothetical protein N8I77_007800 [Diaporthe amygdali]|uniref:SET domain-containing protein n=1 Tax=Phomopsis amygdali TaxID=1214568 RepID=A0AAD9SDI8_PHOAM|nr:hypothetical protein N8I77_007800 [Diaporthe amygdali]